MKNIFSTLFGGKKVSLPRKLRLELDLCWLTFLTYFNKAFLGLEGSGGKKTIFKKNPSGFSLRSFVRNPLLFTLGFLLLSFFNSQDSLGQIAQRGVSTTNTNSGTNISTLTINKPGGVVAGDVLIANIVQNETDNDNGGLTDVTGAGWTFITGGLIRSEGTLDGNNAWWGTVLYRVADGTEGTNFTFDLPNSRADMAVGSIVAFSGVDIFSGFNAAGTANSGPFDVDPGNLLIQTANNTSITTSSITTVTNNAGVIMLTQASDDLTYSNWSSTNLGTLTELYDNITSSGDDASVGVGWGVKATAGTTTGSATLSASNIPRASMLLALRPKVPYRAQFISSDLGSSSWCSGETRNVTVTIRNIGSATWTDASPDINIGVKWNNWGDYYVRTDAENLAPGETRTYTLPVTASNFTNPGGYGSTLTTGSNAITFDLVNEGAFWFGNNTNGGGPGNSVYSIPQTIVPVPDVLDISAVACSESGFSVTPVNGTIPAGTTYSWSAPVVSAGVTGGAAGSGASITGTLVNTTNIALSAIYTVTPITGTCTGSPFTVTVLLHPTAAITPIDTPSCSDGSFSVTPTNGTNGIVPASTNYSWQGPTVTGGVTGGIGGSGTSISGTLTNPTNTSQTATYTVTPVTGSCVGIPFTVTVTVNPKPALTAISSTACNNESFTITPAHGTNGLIPTGTSYSWSAPTVTGTMTGGAAGSGANITGTLFNPTNTAQTATYTVTPTSGNCTGTPFTVAVTVNPSPVIPAQTATACSGSAFTVLPANGVPSVATIVPAGTTYTWTVTDNPNVTGESDLGIAQANISQTLTNTTNVAQTVTYTVTPLSGAVGNCVGTPFSLTVTVNPSPVIPTQTAEVCSGSAFTVLPSNGGATIVPAGTIYTWTVVDNPNVTGESAQGTSQANISQTLTNTTNVAQTVTYNVTPSSGVAGNCVGDPFTVTVTVNPNPVIPAQISEVCSGSAFTVSPVNSGATIIPAGTTYTWTVVDNPNITGDSDQATSQANISQALTNTTNVSQTVTYTITPVSGTCTGAAFTVSVTVDPGMDISPMTDTICSDDTFTVTPTNGTNGLIPSGTNYSWSVPSVTGGLTGGAAGSGASITGNFSNPSNTAQTATYTVIPSSGSCSGNSFTVTVAVNPKAAITTINAPVCTGDLFTVMPVNVTNGVVPAGTTYTWSAPSVTGSISGGAAGSGASITGTLINPTSTPQTATYTVTPLSGSCTGTSFTVIVTVNPFTAIGTHPSQADFEVCFGDGFSPISVVATGSANLTYQWYRNTSSINSGGTPVTGATSASFTPPSTPISVYYYYVVVTGACGVVSSQVSGMYKVTPPFTTITEDLDNTAQTICQGDLFTEISISATGAHLTYEWYSNTSPSNSGGTLIPTATDSTFIPPSDTFGPVYYYAVASSDCGTIPSSVSGAFAITHATSAAPNQTVCLNEPLDPVITHSTTGTTGIGTSTGLPPGVTATWANDVIIISGTPTSTAGSPYNYSIPLIGACGTEFATGTITVNPKSVVNPLTTSDCTGGSFTVAPVNGTNGLVVTGTTYSWSAPAVTGGITGGSTGSGPTIFGTLNNSTSIPQTATYTVTPVSGSCTGPTFSVTVTVNPRPVLSSPITTSQCSNSSTTYTATSDTPGTTFSWTRAAIAGISNAATSGSTATATETLINTTANPINVTYAYTLTANGCSNTQNVTETVNPTPMLSSTLTPAAICNNSAFTYTPTSTTSGATFNWTRAAVTGISNPAVTVPQSSNPTETLVNTTANPIDVVYGYTITANGCTNTQNVTLRVNPTPALSSTLTPASICSNSAFTYTPTSATVGTTFTWTRAAVAGISNVAVTTPQSSNPNETLVNTTANSIDVVYAYTITANGCINTQNVTVTVNPRPAITPTPITTAICSGDTFSVFPVNGTNGKVPAGTTYTWSRVDNTSLSGDTNQSSPQSAISQTLTNTTTSIHSVTYTVTPSSSGCTGNTFQVVVTVNPTPAVNAVTSPPALCNGTPTAPITFGGSPVTGTVYKWTNDNPSIGLAASGTGPTISSFVTVNQGVTPVTANITVTPMANGCAGPSNTFTITVYPTPKVTIVTDYCVVGGRVQLVANSNVPGTTWLWNTGQTTASILVDISGSYYVTATTPSPSNCTVAASIGVAQELVVDGDFTHFDPANPSFFTEYTQNQNFYTGVNTSGLWPEGRYAVNTSAHSPSNGIGYHTNFHGRDHTNNAAGVRNFLMVNGSTTKIADAPNPDRHRIIWQQTVTVEPNTDYYFSAWAMNLNPTSPAILQFEVNGVLVGTIADLNLAPKPTSDGQVNLNNWVRFYSDPTWNAGSATTAVIRIRNLNTVAGGNDFALDDISFGHLSTFIILTSGIGTDNQTVCQDSPIEDITYDVGSGILGPEIIGLPAGITPIWNGVTLRFSGSPTEAGIFPYTITTTGNCLPAIATGTITVRSTPTAGVIAASQTVCSGGDPVAFSSIIAGTGVGTITYRWESNTNLTSPSWATISGQSADTYNAPVLSATTQFRRVTIATAGSLATNDFTVCESEPTEPLQITIQSVPTAGVITASQTICSGGDPVAFTSTTAGTGDGTITYRWESSLSPFSSWFPISGVISANYDAPSGLTVTTQYRRITISTLNSVACESVPTAVVQVTVTPTNTVTPVNPNQDLCINTTFPTTIIHTTTGATGIVPQSVGVDYNLPNGVTVNWAGDELTISGTPTEMGVFDYSIPLAGGCGSISAVGRIIVGNPSYPISDIQVVNPQTLPGTSTFTVYSPGFTIGTYTLVYSTSGVNQGSNQTSQATVTTAGELTFSSLPYSTEGTTQLTILSIQKDTDLCPYFPPSQNTAPYGVSCSTEFLKAGLDNVFYVPADVFQVTIQVFGDGSGGNTASQPMNVLPGGSIFIVFSGTDVFATTVPPTEPVAVRLAQAIVSTTGPNGRIVINYDCTPLPPCTGSGDVFQYTDYEGFTVIRFTGDCSWTAPDGLDEFEVLVVGGGGGGGFGEAAGGGGGGAVMNQQYFEITMNGLPGLQNAVFQMTPGGQGFGANSNAQKGRNGDDSFFTGPSFNYLGGNIFTELSASGGGGGGSSSATTTIRDGADGASGGGGATYGTDVSYGGIGTEGNIGGNGYGETSGIGGGGGGGAGGAGGAAGNTGIMTGGTGGIGKARTISGEEIIYGAGGGGTSSGAITNQAGTGGSQYTTSGVDYFAGGSGTHHGIGQSPTTYGSGGGAGRLGGGEGFPGVIYIRYPTYRILSVEYLYFNAKYNPTFRSGDLSWATAEEWENNRFEIERSVNNLKEWKTIGHLRGGGNSDQPVKYAFQDMKLPLAGGNIFYRLKQFDFDGDSTYSEAKAIQVDPMPGTTYWRVFPNPTTGDPINLEMLDNGAYNDEKIILRVISATGVFDVIEGDSANQLSYQLSDLLRGKAAGIYTLEISWGDNREYHKVILRR